MREYFNLARWQQELYANEARLDKLRKSTTDEGFLRKAAVGAWSAAECVDHLVITAQSFLPLWDDALEGAKPGRGDAKYAWWEKQLMAFLEPPYRLKSKTQAKFDPKEKRTPKEVVELFLAAHALVNERAERLSELAVERVTVTSPFASWMKYNVAFSFDLVLAHERRHLWQAEQAVGVGAQARASEAKAQSELDLATFEGEGGASKVDVRPALGSGVEGAKGVRGGA